MPDNISYLMLGMFITSRASSLRQQLNFYKASDTRFRHTGRIDFSNKEFPRYWASGVYIEAIMAVAEATLILPV